MSSILKALKKLEEEKAAARHDPVRIDAEILRTPPLQRISPMGIALAAALLFVCGGTVTYVYMSRVRPARPLPPQETVPQSATREIETQHRPVRRGTVAEWRPVASPTEGRRKSGHSSGALSRGQRAPSLPPAGESGWERAPTEKSVQVGHATTTSPAPTFRVDGIAFQDGADGVAVVNGVPVSRGSSVEGARVDEVQRDRVLFSRGGKKIEVFMGRSNR
jgi:general secretion pathway protein B